MDISNSCQTAGFKRASAMARLDYSRFNGLGDSDSEDGEKTQEVTWIPWMDFLFGTSWILIVVKYEVPVSLYM